MVIEFIGINDESPAHPIEFRADRAGLPSKSEFHPAGA
jgi:hypothetical protein